MKITRSTGTSSEIPTSSMADIAFLLIIYFMITATFTATRGIDFGLPQDEDTPEIEREDSSHILVQPGGHLVVDGQSMTLDGLLDYLERPLRINPKRPVIIQTDPNAAYGHMVAVLDELRQSEEKAGYEIQNVSIPTRREIAAFWF
jgi:biopolymer transport protein ExbD